METSFVHARRDGEVMVTTMKVPLLRKEGCAGADEVVRCFKISKSLKLPESITKYNKPSTLGGVAKTQGSWLYLAVQVLQTLVLSAEMVGEAAFQIQCT